MATPCCEAKNIVERGKQIVVGLASMFKDIGMSYKGEGYQDCNAFIVSGVCFLFSFQVSDWRLGDMHGAIAPVSNMLDCRANMASVSIVGV